MDGIRNRLTAEYERVRLERPDGDAEEIVELVASRLGPRGRTDLAAEELTYDKTAATRSDAALQVIRHFVRDREGGYAEDDDPDRQ